MTISNHRHPTLLGSSSPKALIRVKLLINKDLPNDFSPMVLLKTVSFPLSKFILPHHKYNVNKKKNKKKQKQKKKRIDVTMARRPKGNYEAYIN